MATKHLRRSQAVLLTSAMGWVLSLAPLANAEQSSVSWRSTLDGAKVEAANSHKLVLIHVWTTTCGPCRVLEREVFSQAFVGEAIEQNFVPVKIDADASPAIASALRIDRVPTDVVMNSQGNVIAMLGCPNTAEGYVRQLQGVARRYEQSLQSPATEGSASVNRAYASLPSATTQQPLTTSAANVAAAGSRPAQPAAVFAPPTAPSVQANPYMASQTPAARQPATPPVGVQQMTATRPSYPAVGVPALPATAQPSAAPPVAATNQMAIPGNAMPNSYLAASVSTGTATTAPPTSAASVNATQRVVSQPPAVPAVSQPAAVAAGAPAVASAAPASSAVAAAVAKPPAMEIPPGSPPLGFDGCCPVTLKTHKRWAPGNPAFGVVHRGRTYLFVGAKERDEFLGNPDAFSPVFAGMDPVLLLERQQATPGSRKFGYEFAGSFYLFSSQETMQRFAASPQTYAAGVRQAMRRIDSPGGTVLR